MDEIKKCCLINDIDFPLLNNEKMIEKKEYKNIFKLMNSTYAIFYVNHNYGFFKSIWKRSLLKYFKNYDIVHLNYNDRCDIINIIGVINKIINIYNKFIDSYGFDSLNKKTDFKNEYNKGHLLYKLHHEFDDNNKIELLTEYEKNIITYKLITDLIKTFNLKSVKIIHFSDNIIDPFTLYKKISFAKEELFFSFENYIIKKQEYKLKTFCQIAEKLGATSIKILSDMESNKESSTSAIIDGPTVGAGMEINNSSSQNNLINLDFKYENYKNNINLNKHYIQKLVEDESEFMITKEEFESDIDYKFLIDARCINLIQKYNTKIIMTHMNELERRFFVKAKGYGLQMNHSSSSSVSDTLNIKIEFSPIYLDKTIECISGQNLYLGKEGFWHLANIIKMQLDKKTDDIKQMKIDEIQQTDEIQQIKTIDGIKINVIDEQILNIYDKINVFLWTQLNYVHKNKITITLHHNQDTNVLNAYDIINLNFKNNVVNDDKYIDTYKYLFYDYFKDNLFYDNFCHFRDILLFSRDNLMDEFTFSKNHLLNKFYFVSIQYHTIIEMNKLVLKDIRKFIFDYNIIKCFNLFICEKYKNDISSDKINNIISKDNIYKITEIIQNKKNKNNLIKCIKDIVYDAFVKYINKYGLRNYGNEHITINDELLEKINDIINVNKLNTQADYKELNSLLISIVYEVEQILYNDFDNRFYEIILEIKLLLNNGDKNYDDEIKHVIKNMIIEIVGVTVLHFKQSEDKKYLIEKLIITLLIKYYQFKNNNYVIKQLQKYNKEDYEHYILSLFPDRSAFIENYTKYKIYYTWLDFKNIINELNIKFSNNQLVHSETICEFNLHKNSLRKENITTLTKFNKVIRKIVNKEENKKLPSELMNQINQYKNPDKNMAKRISKTQLNDSTDDHIIETSIDSFNTPVLHNQLIEGINENISII